MPNGHSDNGPVEDIVTQRLNWLSGACGKRAAAARAPPPFRCAHSASSLSRSVDSRGTDSAFVKSRPKSTPAIIVELNRVLRSEPTHNVRAAAEPRKALRSHERCTPQTRGCRPSPLYPGVHFPQAACARQQAPTQSAPTPPYFHPREPAWNAMHVGFARRVRAMGE